MAVILKIAYSDLLLVAQKLRYSGEIFCSVLIYGWNSFISGPF